MYVVPSVMSVLTLQLSRYRVQQYLLWILAKMGTVHVHINMIIVIRGQIGEVQS